MNHEYSNSYLFMQKISFYFLFFIFFIYHVFSRIIMRHFNLTSIFFLKLIRIDIYGFKINKLNFIYIYIYIYIKAEASGRCCHVRKKAYLKN